MNYFLCFITVGDRWLRHDELELVSGRHVLYARIIVLENHVPSSGSGRRFVYDKADFAWVRMRRRSRLLVKHTWRPHLFRLREMYTKIWRADCRIVKTKMMLYISLFPDNVPWTCVCVFCCWKCIVHWFYVVVVSVFAVHIKYAAIKIKICFYRQMSLSFLFLWRRMRAYLFLFFFGTSEEASIIQSVSENIRIHIAFKIQLLLSIQV